MQLIPSYPKIVKVTFVEDKYDHNTHSLWSTAEKRKKSIDCKVVILNNNKRVELTREST